MLKEGVGKMKKIKTIQKRSANNKWQNWLGLVGILGVALVGIVFAMNSFQDKKEASAHPTKTAEIGSVGDKTNYTVPVDAIRIREDDLPTQYKTDHLQGESIVPILEKEYIDATGAELVYPSAINVSIMSIERTEHGNYIVLYSMEGNGRGGLIKVAVHSKDGTYLTSDEEGVTSNRNLRVNTTFYNADNNEYLVGTQSMVFFRYTVSGETDTSATLTKTRLNVPNNPNSSLLTDYHYMVDTFSDYSNKSLIVGLMPGSNSNDIRNRRLSFAEIDVSGWEGTGFAGTSNYLYSVESVTPEEEFNNATARVLPLEYYKRNNVIFGVFNTTRLSSNRYSVQIFNENEEIPDEKTGDMIKKRKYLYKNDNRIINVVKELCTDDKIYFIAQGTQSTDLIEVDLTTYEDRVIKTYPKDTYLKLIDNKDGTISYYGSTSSLTDEFHSDYYTNALTGPKFFVSGLMEDLSSSSDELKVLSLRALSINGNVMPTQVMSISPKKLFVGGTTTDGDVFADTLQVHDANGNVQPGLVPSGSLGFVGVLDIKDDYSPVIKGKERMTINISDKDLQDLDTIVYKNWNCLDRWLITGSKNGEITDSQGFSVYDHFDIQNNQLGTGVPDREEWLLRRMNRNPKTINAKIEWEKLGFDKTKAGPQTVSYFVTDTQGQAATTSRLVNSKTSQTIEEGDCFFDAQNFHIPLDGIGDAIPDENKFKELAKTMAWNQVSGVLDEDGTKAETLSSKISVDEDQLIALQRATVAKPYPVDVTYQPEIGVSITNRVWVFLTTKNTQPNTATGVTPTDTNGMVFYADDYSSPYRLRKSHTVDDVLSMGNVRVYDYYDSSNENKDELPVLADAKTNPTDLEVQASSMNDIISAPNSGLVTPSTIVKYKWTNETDRYHVKDKQVTGTLDVTLYSEGIFHIRQVVVDPSQQLVTPSEGYIEVNDRIASTGQSGDYQSHVITKSGALETKKPEFTNTVIATDHLANASDQLILSVIVPEFYQYIGYYCTTEQADPKGQTHQSNTTYTNGPVLLDKDAIDVQEEFWITVYLRPSGTNDGNPQPHSWDYKQNDLGKITD